MIEWLLQYSMFADFGISAMTIMAIAAVASVGMTAYSLANQPGMPKPPGANTSAAGIEAEAGTLADRRRIEAAAQQGGEALKRGYREITEGERQRETLQAQLESARAELGGLTQLPNGTFVKQGFKKAPQPVNPAPIQNRIADLEKQIANIPEGGGTVFLDPNGRVVSREQAMVSFEGYGEADVQGAVARSMAENILALQEKYGPQFIEEALRQQELADPEGAAARRKLYELIQEQADADPDRPVAALLDEQVAEQLAAGRGLDRVSDEMLREAVAQSQGARGEAGGAGVRWEQPLTEGFAGEQRQTAAQQKALGWLTSGATPEDVAYRREQATLGNLGAFVEGVTPQSQFANLSGAQQGPAPFLPGQPLPGQPGTTGSATSAAAQQGWNANVNAAAQQADPWMAGLSTLLGGLTVAGKAGWRPLQP